MKVGARFQHPTSRLAAISVAPSHFSIRDVVIESLRSVSRQPGRTVLAALGTVIGVAAGVATLGLGQSAGAAVSSTFDAQRATQITFQDESPLSATPILTEQSEARIEKLNGVRQAGLVWDANGGQPMEIEKSDLPDITGLNAVSLPVTVVSPGALTTMNATVSYGRLYDAGFEKRHIPVGVLGATAAAQLGITRTDGNPAIFIGSSPITIVGIVSHVTTEGQALLGLIIPPDTADGLGLSGSPRLDVTTGPGAAQTIGAQGPDDLSPSNPSLILAEVPPNPTTLRQQVSSSVTSLLLALALLSLTVGVLAIVSTTLLSVIQRRPEIGLRRALGAKPSHIASQVLWESATVGAVGGIIGTSAGILATAITALAKGWTPVLDPRIMLATPILGIIAGMIAGIYPSHRATKIPPVAALQRT